MKVPVTLFILFSFLLGFIVSSCKKDGSNPIQPNNEFYLRLSVKDSVGQPASNLQVSLWNRLDNDPYPTSRTQNNQHVSSIASSTVINFDSPIQFNGSLAIFDLKNNKIVELLDTIPHEAGRYAVTWSLENLKPSVYRIQFTAKNLTYDSILYQQSILGSLHHTDASQTIQGYTSTNGGFETKEVLSFPFLFNLPPLEGRSPNNDSIGTFSYTDSVTIILTDTTTKKYQVYERKIKNSPNDFTLTWNPVLSESLVPSGSSVNRDESRIKRIEFKRASPDTIVPPVHIIPTKFKLYQNYPNPFN